MHLRRMLDSSSSSTSSSSSSNHLPKPPFIASSSSSHHHHHHPQLPPSPPLHPALLAPLTHHHHLHHLHAYVPSVNSTQPLHAYGSNGSAHCLYPLPQASLTTSTIDTCSSGSVSERLSTHIDPHCQATIKNNINHSVFSSSDNISSRHYSTCYTTDCSPRSVIRHVQSSSSAPSPDRRRPSCYYTNSSTNTGTPMMITSPHQRTDLSTIVRHHPAPHETSQAPFLLMHQQAVALDPHHLPPPVRSPEALHHHYYDVCSNFEIPSTRSGHNNFEGGMEELNRGGETRKGSKLSERGSRSVDLHKQQEIEQFKSGYFSASAVEHRPCMIESNDRAGYGSIERHKKTMMASKIERANHSVNVNKCTATKPMHKTTPDSMHIDHGHNLQARSLDAAVESGERLINSEIYSDAKGVVQLGSKWEDAEKWVRPVNYQYDIGCRGFANLGLLKMHSCLNSGTAIKPNHMHHGNGHVAQPILSSDCISNYGSDFSTSNCANYGPRSSFSNFNSDRFSAQQESMPALASRTVHVDCFQPHLSSSSPHLTYARSFSPYAQLATVQQIEEQLSKLRTGGNEQSYQHLHERSTGKARQQHYASPGSGISMASKLARDNYNVLCYGMNSEEIKVAHRQEASLPPYHFTPHQQLITDRFASEEVMCHSPTPQVLYARHNDENLLTMPTMQRGVQVPMVVLREVGTQISSIDGSGSISRFTSKNGSPQKSISPARHNTPAHMRSLNASTNNINHIREVEKQAIDLEELVNCHRAKLELQALSEGERIHSFHRTTSNWSSREMEEADLSRSLRHSTELDEHHNNKNDPWPSQSFSWNKDEDSKLAKLQLKEARIKAWEDNKRSKADAQLKKLEESLAKKRAHTTNRIMGNLRAAHIKAEEMRASVYAQQKKPTNKAHSFRHRSLSPLSRCICFSPLL